jgi:hypothetical protein
MLARSMGRSGDDQDRADRGRPRPLPGAGQRVAADGGFEVVGEAADARSALEAVGRLQPSVTLLASSFLTWTARGRPPVGPGRGPASDRAGVEPRQLYLPSSAGREPGPWVHPQEGPVGSRGRRARRLNDASARSCRRGGRFGGWGLRPNRGATCPRNPGWRPPPRPSASPSSALGGRLPVRDLLLQPACVGRLRPPPCCTRHDVPGLRFSRA